MKILLVHVIDGADANLAGVVDQHIQAAMAADGALDGALHLALIGDVAGDAQHISAAGGDVEHGLLEIFAIASDERDVRAFGGELAGEDKAEAARASGDEDVSTAQVDGAGGADDALGQISAAGDGGGGGECGLLHVFLPIEVQCDECTAGPTMQFLSARRTYLAYRFTRFHQLLEAPQVIANQLRWIIPKDF